MLFCSSGRSFYFVVNTQELIKLGKFLSASLSHDVSPNDKETKFRRVIADYDSEKLAIQLLF